MYNLKPRADLEPISVGMIPADNTSIASMMDDSHGADDETPGGRCKKTVSSPVDWGKQDVKRSLLTESVGIPLAVAIGEEVKTIKQGGWLQSMSLGCGAHSPVG